MKRGYILLMICISFNFISLSQSYSPIPVTGFNEDVIANGTETAATSTSASFDDPGLSGNVFYAVGFSTGNYGLPADGYISSVSNSGYEYNLADYSSNNVLHLYGSEAGTLTLQEPGIYETMSILAASAQGSSTFSVIINYSDGTSDNVATFNVPDWFNGSGYAIMGVDRVNRTSGNFDNNSSNPRLYDNTLSVDKTKIVTSLTFTKTSSTSYTGIYAICGITPAGVPDATTTNAATNITDISFTANWDAVNGATGYRIDVATDNTFSSMVSGYNNLSVSGTSKEISGLDSETTYYYRVRAVNASGQSLNSNTTEVTTDLAPPKRALNFDGTDDYVTTGAGLVNFANDMTVEAWFNTTNSNSFNSIATIEKTAAGTNDFLQILTNSAGNIYLDDANDASIITTTESYNDGNWHHVAFVRNATTKTIYLYVDGDLKGSETYTYSGTIDLDHELRFGNSEFTAGGLRPNGSYLMDGMLDEIRIWDDVRTVTEIRDNLDYSLVGNEANLVAYYNFDNTAGTTLIDNSSNSHTGTLENMSDADWVSSGAMVYAPTALAATSVTSSTATANWERDYTATKYYIDVSTANDFTSYVAGFENKEVNGQATLSQALTGLNGSPTYYYRVRAYNGNTNQTSANSNVINFTTSAACSNPTDGGTIASAQTICFGTTPNALTSSALPTGHTGTLEYKWQSSTTSSSSGFSDIASSNTSGYSPGDLIATTWFKRLARVDCQTDWSGAVESNVVKVTVYNDFTPGTIETTGEPICYDGDPTSIGSSTAASGGDESITYQWQSSSDAAFTSPIDIASSNSASYDPPANLTSTTWYRRQAKDGTCNTSWETSTGVWKVTVYDDFTPGSIATTGETICYEGDPGLIGSSTAASGGDGNITYQWRSSSDNYSSAISGATSATYNPPSGLTTSTSYRRYTHDGMCNTSFEQSTGTWNVTVRNNFTPGVIQTTGETICYGGDPGVIGSSTAASGGDESISYQWRSSADNYSSAISGATLATYNPPSGLTTTTSYRRYAHDGTCNTSFEQSTGTWTVSVHEELTISCPADIEVTNDANECGAEVTFSVTATGTPSPTVTYKIGETVITSHHLFAVGTTTVDVTATNSCGTKTCSFDVKVTDDENPAPNCPTTNLSSTADPGECQASLSFSATPTDNCGVLDTTYSVNETPITFPYDFPVGMTTVDVLVTDVNTNTSTCSFDVTVTDDEDPVVKTNDVSVYLDASGNGSITVDQIDNGSTDNCGIQLRELSKTDFTCDNVGENTVTLTVTDIHNNSASKEATVTVLDKVKPELTTQNIIRELDEFGSTIIGPEDVVTDSWDACGIQDTTLSKYDFDCSNVGDNTISVTLTDVNGNQTVKTAVVTIIDNIPPEALCKNDTVYLGADGTGTTSVAEIDDGSNDACGISQMLLSKSIFDCDNIDLSPHTIYLNVYDNSYNRSVCSAKVTVLDTVKPVALCKDITVELDESGNASIVPSQIDDGSNDACGILSLSLDETDFSCNDVGANTVTMSVTDVNENYKQCMATVTVEDIISPTALCKDITVQLDKNGEATIDSLAIDNGSSDNCGLASHTLDVSSFGCGDVGVNTVNMTLTDVNGNSFTCSSTVTVEDTISPTALCKDITVQLDENEAAIIDSLAIDNGSSDNCSLASHVLNFRSFSCGDVGANTVTMTVNDVNGNSSTCSSTVTVVDTVSPTARCKNTTVQLDASGALILDSLTIDNGSSDNCSLSSHTLDVSSFDCGDIGTHTVTMTIADGSGNSDQCSSTVTVHDNVPPEALCKNLTVYLDKNGEASITPGQVDNGSNDACGILSRELDITRFTCNDVGNNPVELTVTDNHGNSSVCVASVNVKDTIAPELNLNPIEVFLGEDGQHIFNNSEIKSLVKGTIESCSSVDNMQISVWPGLVGCNDVGANTVRVTAADESGNASSDWVTITVRDTISPEIDAVANIETEIEPGECETEIDYPEITASDNCEATISQTAGLGPDAFFPVGTTTETWVATDESGNTDTVSFTVTVLTTNAPPTLDSIPDVTVMEDAGTEEVAITGISHGIDCTKEDVTVAAEITSGADIAALDTVMYTSGNDSAKLTLTLVPDMNGEVTVAVTVKDAAGDSVTQTMTLTVVPVNDPPFLVTPIADQMVNASYRLAVSISSVLGEYFDDIDNETLTFITTTENGSQLPDWATINATGDSLIATPMIADTGCVNIVIQASDGEYSATDTFRVCVEGYPTSITDIGAGKFEVNLYPNPTRGMVNVDVESTTLSDVELTVLDITGKQVLRKQYRAADRITFDMSGKVSGMYFVKLDFEGKQVLKKLIVDRE